MSSRQNGPPGAADGSGNLLLLAFLALIAGAAAGLVGAVFRLALEQADVLRGALIGWAHGQQLEGFWIVVGACAAAALVAASLVRRLAPYASGSGIPHVEAVLNGDLPGGAVSHHSGEVRRRRAGDRGGRSRSVVRAQAFRWGRPWPTSSGKCSGATGPTAGCFWRPAPAPALRPRSNAPIAGAIFVLEELDRRFEPRIAIAALGASATAIAVSRVLLGNAPDFDVGALNYGSAETRPLYFFLGAFAGLMAIVYNRSLLAAMAAAAWMVRLPVELRAALIGAAVGALAWVRPDLVGGGDTITQSALAGGGTLAILPLVFVLRLGLGAVSYAAMTPGGLFAPLLVLGAQLGLFFGLLSRLRISRSRHSAGRVRRRRHGRHLHRRGASAADRHRARHRDDGECHDAPADARGLLRSDVGSDASVEPASVRFLARKHSPTRTCALRPYGQRSPRICPLTRTKIEQTDPSGAGRTPDNRAQLAADRKRRLARQDHPVSAGAPWRHTGRDRRGV